MEDPLLGAPPTFLFFKGAAHGLFAAGADQLGRDGVDDLEALRIGIRCERGSHRFFKRYGERFEDSEGKQIFLGFAEEERQHLELLIREYRLLRKKHHAAGASTGRARLKAGTARGGRGLHQVRAPFGARDRRRARRRRVPRRGDAG